MGNSSRINSECFEIFAAAERRRRARLHGVVKRAGSHVYRMEALEQRMLLSYSTLISFTGTAGADPGNNTDGAPAAEGAPVMDSSGNIYGVTPVGGTNGNGTLWELASGATSITVLHTFSTLTSSDNADGANPYGGLLIDGSGNLYGTASAGGTAGVGTIFEYSTSGSTFTTLASFQGSSYTSAKPYAGLIMDGSGNLYGTTEAGGANGHGSIFELASTGGGTYSTNVTVLYSLSSSGTADGKNPYGGLVMDGSGNLFGTTKAGGADGDGVIFELASGATATTTLYSFTNSTDGKEPLSSLILDSSGDLIGTAEQGGANSDGTLFKLTKSGGVYSTTLTTLFSFKGGASAGDGELPYDSPIIDSKGDIFGTNELKDTGADGDIWELAVGATSITILHAFTGNPDGNNPYAGLYMDSRGNLWGTTAIGGASNDGSIFEITSQTKLAYGTQPASTTAGTLSSFTVDVEDAYGNILTGDTSNVTLAVNSGPGSIGGTDTVAAVAGVATFTNVTLDTAGAYTLTASDTGDTSVTSSSFTISAAAASKVVFNQQPTAVTAGVAISPSITVDVEDQFNNIVTSDSSNVTLSVASGGGTVSGTATVAASSGVATFSNAILDTAGSHTLQAADGSLTTATSNSFVVSVAGAAQLAFVQNPTNANAGSTISPNVTVAVEDQFGNVVTTDSSNVVLSVNTGTGSLGGTLTEAASSGIATFANLSMTAAGAKTLLASDGSLSTATSSSFTIAAVGASQLAFETQPSNVTAGNANSPSITVAVEDQYGNVVTGDSSTVALAINTGPGSIGGTDSVAASSGVATFNNVVLDTAGAYTLAASDGSLTGVNSSSFTVSAASANKLAFNQQPSTATAGVANSPAITVDVEDQFGNIVTTDTSNVTLARNTGTGNPSGTLTVAAVAGVATFSNVIEDASGSHSLTASDGSLTTANSSSFTINAAAPSQIIWGQEPSDAAAGVANSPEIILNMDDQFGNVCSSYGSNVTLTVNSGPGSVSGTDTVAFSSGVAQLSNVIIDTAGTYTLTATSGLITANSSSFTISAASASQLAFSQQPTDVVINSPISPSITVDVEDQFNNIVTGDSSNVTLALHSGTGAVGGTDTVAASSGVATFSNVTVNSLGAHTLAASDGSLTVADSSSFAVNPAPASQIVFDQQPTTVTAGSAISPSITVDLEDQFGDIVTTDTSTVTLTVASGPGSIGGTDSVAAVAGVATFSNVIFDTSGTYTITAANGVASDGTSNSFTVNPGNSDKVEFVQNPTTTTAGGTISPAVTVAVEDQFGNVVTGDSSNVTLSVNSGTGSLSGTLTKAASSGIATFNNLSMTAAGAKTLLAVDGSLAAADSGSFTINPTSASQLAYSQQPSTVTAGVANSPSITVDVEDQYGNVVTSNSSNVTLSIHSGPGSIGGTDTVAASSGVATFNNVVLDTAGSYSLAAADGSLTGVNSSAFTVNPTAASKLVYTQQPSTVTAGVANSPNIVVDVEDQYGNVITTDSSNVTLSVASGGGSVTGTATVAASSGIATFSNAILDTAGTHTLLASDGSLTTTTSSSFTVNPAAASQLAYGQQPSTVAAGSAISPAVTVKVEDQFGNTVTSDSSNVTLSVHTGPGSIGGTDTVAASSGVATFSNVTFTTTGSYTLAAADGSLTGANSSAFTVTPSATQHIAIVQQPSTVAAGVADSPAIVVAIEDQFDNVVTTDTSTVTLAVDIGPGAIGGTDSVATVNGVATFSNVKFNTAGSYTVSASNNILPVATFNSFTVTPAAASQVVFNQQPSTVTAGSAISPSITVDVEDQFGNVVTSNTSNVTLAIHTGAGSIGGTDTVAAVAGVATFSNVLIDTAGAHTLAATDGVLTGATSSAFTVNPAAASQLAFNQQPSTVAAGSAISPSMTVDVEDQFGNIVTSNTSNVTLAIHTGPGSIGGTDTVAAVAGVATFSNVKINTAGSYTLAASDGALTGANSGAFTVNPAAASQLVVNQGPSDVTAGSAISPSITIDVEDAFGNIVATNSSNVTLAIHTGPGSIGGTDTVAASSGVATFSNVVLDTAGIYTLAVSDGALTGANTSSFTVSPGAASQVAFSQQPTRTVVSMAIDPAMTVNVEDRFGNIVTSDSSTITLSVHTGPGTLTGTVSAAAVNGVATFDDVVIDITGTYTLNAADGSLTSGNSSSFVVGSTGVPTQLVFLSLPSTTWQYGPVTPTVQVAVEDAFGNIVPDADTTITLSDGASGSLGGTLTVSTVNGVATFSNLYVAKPGSFTFQAAGDSLSVTPSFSVQAVSLPTPVHTRALINPARFDPTYILHLEQYEGRQLSEVGPPSVGKAHTPTPSAAPALAAAFAPTPQTTMLTDNVGFTNPLLK
jgi:uncharacterized repeat protein (TIGR03803 family)